MGSIIVLTLYIFETATALEGIALVHDKEIVALLDVLVTGATQLERTPEDDYPMPTPPVVSCTPPAPALSVIGGSVLDALNDYYFGGDYNADAYFSVWTYCNEVEGDWLLDVGDDSSQTASTSPEEFYGMIGELIRDTDYTFSLSTLGFDTHDQAGELNLVKEYLAPAIRDLHDNTPAGGPYPLLRFLYSESDAISGPFSPPEHDEAAEVFNDLTAELPLDEPWRVSIAVAAIGYIPTSPWNHSKIAVSDYRHSIVGGMNWSLDYVLPVDIDGDGTHNPVASDGRTVHELYDLSVQVEGDAANQSGIFFDKLWRRTFGWPISHLGADCKTSWEFNPPLGELWDHDCPLEQVPVYATGSEGTVIPNYSVNQKHNIFALGRGHVDNVVGGGPIDNSADEAVLAAFDAADDSIYISQHKLTLTEHDTFIVSGVGVPGYYFAYEVRDALIDAILRGVQVKIALSEPWGMGGNDTVEDVYHQLDDAVYEAAQEYYQNLPPSDREQECLR